MTQRSFWTSVLILVVLSTTVAIGARIRPDGDPRPDRVIWANPFDNYSQWAWDNRDNAAYQPYGTLWQGGPVPAGSITGTYPYKSDNGTADPYNGCGVTMQSSPGRLKMAWEDWISSNPTNANIITPAGFSVGPCTFYAGPDKFKAGTNCTSGGWVQTIAEFGRSDSVWQSAAGYYTSLSIFTHDLTPRIQSWIPNLRAWDEANPNAVQGTDEHPLALVFYLSDSSAQANNPRAFTNNGYVELSMDGDHAPTDYIWRGKRDMNYESGDPECCPEGPYPIICQQVREVNDGYTEQTQDLTYLNDHCPSLVPPFDPQTGAGKTWAAIAFGFMAIGDKDPCKCFEQGLTAHRPQMKHPMLFDGNVWRALTAGKGTALTECPPSWGTPDPVWGMQLAGPETTMQDSGGGAGGDFLLGGASHKVYMKLTTNKILIWMQDNHGDYCGAFDRVYKGSFNNIALGVGPGCELKDKAIQGDEYVCKPGGTPKQSLTYSNTQIDGFWRTDCDAMSLLDGKLVHVTKSGACCIPDGTCQPMSSEDCTTAGGNYRGDYTTCDGSTCLGACCQPEGACTQTLVNACTGDYSGAGTDCATPRQCCPTPFADWDRDHDLDMADFAALQRCLTIGGGAIQAGCICFDQNKDTQIDQADVLSFVNCAGGPDVIPASVPPECAP